MFMRDCGGITSIIPRDVVCRKSVMQPGRTQLRPVSYRALLTGPAIAGRRSRTDPQAGTGRSSRSAHFRQTRVCRLPRSISTLAPSEIGLSWTETRVRPFTSIRIPCIPRNGRRCSRGREEKPPASFGRPIAVRAPRAGDRSRNPNGPAGGRPASRPGRGCGMRTSAAPENVPADTRCCSRRPARTPAGSFG
jgi:hypothetical protein